MKKDEIKKHLSKYKNVIEMIREANILKGQGESEIMVNRCVAELRKEMLAGSSNIKRLARVAIKDTEMSEVGFIPLQIDDLSAPVIVTDGDSVLM